jgi:hypothetical protein
MKYLMGTETFGHVHELEIGALSLRDVGVHYFNTVLERFNLTPSYVYAPDGDVLTTELMIKDPNDCAAFCSFEQFSMKETAVGALRFALGRKSNTDFGVVSPINLFFADNKHVPGCVSFKIEWSTSKGNGDTGEIRPPHLGDASKNPLKKAAYLNKVYAYARANLPRTHTLIATDHWHELPPHIHTVR